MLPNAIGPSRLTLVLKRTFDIVVSGLAIVVLLPLFILVAAAIKADSSGPVFFRQVRVGRDGRSFRIVKFRSMVDGASRVGTALTVHADPRVTRVGSFLRDRKIDELPQLFNVFAGSMSFVGPRPEVPEYMEFYNPEQRELILSMRPGITDYAAMLFRNESEILDGESDPIEVYRKRILPIKLALYERYSREIGLLNDLRIICATLALLLTSKTVNWFHTEQDLSVAAAPARLEARAAKCETADQVR